MNSPTMVQERIGEPYKPNRKRSKLRFSVEWYLSIIVLVTCLHSLAQVKWHLDFQERNDKANENLLTMWRTESTGMVLKGAMTSPGVSQMRLGKTNLGESVDTCGKEYDKLTADRLPGLTDEDILRSKTNIGNRYRLAKFAEKLQMSSKSNWNDQDPPTPMKVAVCGGSITLGHGVRHQHRYSQLLENWMNEKYPLPSLDRHVTFNRGTHGADICAMAKRLNQLMEDLPPDIDMFVLEFAVNDYQGQDHIEMILDRTDLFFDGFEDIAVCTETVLVRLLNSYPDAAVIFVEMRTAVIPRKSASILHMGAAQHYQVPVLSYEQVLWPDFSILLDESKEFEYSRPVNDTILPFPHGCAPCKVEYIEDFFASMGCQSVCQLQRWSEPDLNCTPPEGREPCYTPFFAHDEVHPSAVGHKIVSDLIVDAIASTSLTLCHQKQKKSQFEPRLLQASHRDIMPDVGWMTNDPAILEAQTNFIMVNDTYQMFSEIHDLLPSTHTKGFKHFEDKFERYGWISTSVEGNEQIEFDIKLSGENHCYIPYLSVLKSYENMGEMTVTVIDRATGNETVVEIDSLWKPRISIPVDIQLLAPNDIFAEQTEGCSGDCVVRITTKPKSEGRTGNKVKIITLSARPCIPEDLLPLHP